MVAALTLTRYHDPAHDSKHRARRVSVPPRWPLQLWL